MPKIQLAIIAVLVWILVPYAWAAEPQVIQLWPNGAPGSEGKTAPETVRISPEGDHVVSSVHHPSLTVYLPPREKATGAGVVIIPGGGHRELWMDHEGYRIAQWLSDHGVAGFIVKYRLAAEPGSTYKVERESLSDVQRAIRTVHSRAAEWNVDPQRIGVIGLFCWGDSSPRLLPHATMPERRMLPIRLTAKILSLHFRR